MQFMKNGNLWLCGSGSGKLPPPPKRCSSWLSFVNSLFGNGLFSCFHTQVNFIAIIGLMTVRKREKRPWKSRLYDDIRTTRWSDCSPRTM